MRDTLKGWLLLSTKACNAASYGVGRCPGSLEVEAARDTVNVEHFAGKIKLGDVKAFQRCWIDGTERETAAGDELILEGHPSETELPQNETNTIFAQVAQQFAFRIQHADFQAHLD